jgi:hypothetical protein
MNRAFLKLYLAILPLFGLSAAAPDCHGWDGISSCCPSCCWPHNWHLIDCYTRCAWRRTWHGPNALATPLTEYYVPRPPACCWNGGGLWGGADRCGCNLEGTYATSNDFNCENRNVTIGREVSPSAAAVYSPVQIERLGKVPNELDIVGPAAGPAPSRAAAPAR